MQKYTKELLEQVVKESTSMREVIDKLDLKIGSGSVSRLYKLVKRHSIDRSHFIKRENQSGVKYPIEDYLSGLREITSTGLRNRLFSEGLKKRQCEKCGITDWLGQYLSFELHHVDENHENNDLSNLLIVCPNCHYCVHNAKKIEKERLKRERLDNGTKRKVVNQADRSHTRKVERPPLKEIQKMVESVGYCATGRHYGVSDNCIRKWIKAYSQ